MKILRLSNPTEFVRSATIVKSGEYYILNATTKYGDKHEVSRSLHGLKVAFGIHLLQGAKWKEEP